MLNLNTWFFLDFDLENITVRAIRLGNIATIEMLKGADFEFFQVQPALSDQGFQRQLSEPVMAWISSLANTIGGKSLIGALMAAAMLHNHYRFDPRGLDQAHRQELNHLCKRLLAGITGLNR